MFVKVLTILNVQSSLIIIMQTTLKWNNTKNENPRKVRKLIETVVCEYRNLELRRFKNELLSMYLLPSLDNFTTAL